MKQLLILSGKGGTGKTTVATAMIFLSNAKAYADCDVDAPNLHLLMKPTGNVAQQDYFGMGQAEIDQTACILCGICKTNCRFDAIKDDRSYYIDPFACEGCGVCERVCPVDAIHMKPSKAGDLMLYKSDAVFSTAQLKMGRGTSGMLVTEVKKRLKRSASDVEFAIIDGSPGIGCPVIASISGVDMILIVTEPSLSGISDMERIIETAKKFQTKTAICVNKYDTNSQLTDQISEYCKAHQIPFVGTIPFDNAAVMAINNGMSIVELDCAAGDAVKEVYAKTMILFESMSDSLESMSDSLESSSDSNVLFPIR